MLPLLMHAPGWVGNRSCLSDRLFPFALLNQVIFDLDSFVYAWLTTIARRRLKVTGYGPITIAIRARFEYDSSTIQLQQSTTRYEVFRALAYEIDSSTPRESVVGVSCMLTDSSMHTIFTSYLYRPTIHRVCEYARNCLYKRN